MTKKDFFNTPFDESTLTKLFVFEQYTKSWLPVFLKQKVACFYIFDFFAGEGYDSKGIPGSPIRILRQIKAYTPLVLKSHTKIVLFLNEKNKKHFKKLRANCNSYINMNRLSSKIVRIVYYNEDFIEVFEKVKTEIGKYPSLIFLDQSGVQFGRYIQRFENFERTDFLLFISSSYLKRFANTKEFRNALNLKDEDVEKIKNTPYNLIHEAAVQFLRKGLPPNSPLKLYSFSIKKGKNIYGLIFGAKHILAADKFLRIVWKINPKNGSANYDIYNDEEKEHLHLFPDLVNKTTVQIFQENLEREVIEKRIRTNEDAYYYTLEHGHIPKHATPVFKNLKKRGIISFKRSSRINYANVIRNRRIINYYEKNKD